MKRKSKHTNNVDQGIGAGTVSKPLNRSMTRLDESRLLYAVYAIEISGMLA